MTIVAYLLEREAALTVLYRNVTADFAELHMSFYVSITLPDRNTRQV